MISFIAVRSDIPQTTRYGRDCTASPRFEVKGKVRGQSCRELRRTKLGSARMLCYCENRLAISCGDPDIVYHQLPLKRFESLIENDSGSTD